MKSAIKSARWSSDSDRVTLTVLQPRRTSDLKLLPQAILGRRNGLKTLVAFIAFVGLGVMSVILIDDYAHDRQTVFHEYTRGIPLFGSLKRVEMTPWTPNDEASISVKTLLLFAEDQLAARVAAYDTHGSIYDDYSVQFKYPTLNAYRDAMRTAWEYWFEPDDVYSRPEGAAFGCRRDIIMSHLDLAGPMRGIDEELPHTIYTTSKGKKPDYADQFKGWTDLNPDWQVRNFDDEATSDWLNTTFRVGDGESAQYAQLVSEFNALNRGVLKSDVFRYLVMFLNGGIYTDTDTSAVRPIADWPGLWSGKDTKKIIGEPILSTLPQLLRLAGQEDADASAKRGSRENGQQIVALGTSDEALDAQSKPPRLTVAIEFDAITGQIQWKSGDYARGLQFTQWTIAARPHHPVFLDVINYALKMAEDHRLGIAEEKGVLDMTGPGSWSDALFNYLLVRWGVTPEQVAGTGEAVRVVIYPINSFRASTKASRASASQGWQGDFQVVWHGFFGRWKGEDASDP